ncbi:hypothetical protein GCM10010429_46750 [Micromonospora olivasterospora]
MAFWVKVRRAERNGSTPAGERPDPPRSFSAPGLHVRAGGSRVGAQTLEQILTDVTAHDPNLFREAPGADAAFDHTPAVDVSSAAMTRLRTPFRVERDADRKPTAR